MSILVFLLLSSLTQNANEWREVSIKTKDLGFNLHFDYMNTVKQEPEGWATRLMRTVTGPENV